MNTSQNGDMISQSSMNRGESDNYTNDSNKLNLSQMPGMILLKKPSEINSDTMIDFVN